MVDVSGKPVTVRSARARGTIYLQQATLDAITDPCPGTDFLGDRGKGDVFAAARIAGIMAAKRCDELIPLCHSLALEHVVIDLQPRCDPPRVEICSEVTCTAKTGAEMEALVAVSVAALTIYDMVKAVDKAAVISDIQLVEKSGGKSGHFSREENVCKEE